jgi:hypothetical protein
VTELPPAGWFDDPEYPGYLRYWDGHTWTDYRAPLSDGGHRTGRLTDIGAWLGKSFEDLWNRWVPLLVLSALILGTFIVGGATASWAVDDLMWFDGEWSGYDGSRIVVAGLVGLLAAVLSLFGYVAVVHQMHGVASGDDPSLGDSLRASVAATPRVIGWSIVIMLIVMGALLAVGVFLVIAVPLGLLAALAFIPIGFWLWVRFAFFVVAVVAPVPGRGPLAASAEVSAGGRFWAVCGRLLLLGLIAGGISWALSFPVTIARGSDPSLDGIVEVDDNDDLVLVHVGDLVDELTGGSGLWFVVGGVPQVVGSLVEVAGITGLYVQVHGRRDPV